MAREKTSNIHQLIEDRRQPKARNFEMALHYPQTDKQATHKLCGSAGLSILTPRFIDLDQ